MAKSIELRNQFTKLIVQNKSVKDIFNEMNGSVSLSTVEKWKRQLRTQGNLTPKKQPGRPKKHGEREVRHLVRAARSNPYLTIKEIASRAGFEGNHKTIVKRLKENGLQSFVQKVKPKLTNAHILKRRSWAERKRNETFDDWAFSDECSIELDCTEGARRVIVERVKRHDTQYCAGRSQNGGGKLMIWSYITRFEKGPLIFIEGGMTGELYKQILRNYVLPACEHHLATYGNVLTYMDDGASCHDANEVIDFCSQKGIQRPFWPPNSPDMNPIEWMWGYLKIELANLKAKPRDLEELKRVVTNIWAKMDFSYIDKLFQTMPKRILTLIQKEGQNTKY